MTIDKINYAQHCIRAIAGEVEISRLMHLKTFMVVDR